MLVIGVTGGVGTGKSTVSLMLVDLGAELLDTDALAHEMILPGGPAYPKLVEVFGQTILSTDGYIDRRRLGRLAFSDAKGASQINDIVHPHVIAAIRDRLSQLRASAARPPALVLDVPLLFESGLDELCDCVWVVVADPEVRRWRLEAREGAAANEVLAREAWLMPLAEKAARADAVIDNSGTREATLEQVRRLWSACLA